MQIGRRAVGDRTMGHVEIRYAAEDGAAQRRHIEGLPLGTRGGLAFEHYFPLDAEYEIAVQAVLPSAGWDNPTGRLVWCDGPTVNLTFNGAPIDLDARRRVRLRVAAGPQRIAAALVDAKPCAGVNELYLGEVALEGGVTGLVIDGPFDATGAGDTPSRREIFVCKPEAAAAETPCAQRILARLATRAYRRPVAADDDSMKPCWSSIGSGARKAAISRSASNTRCRGCSSIRGSFIGSRATPPTSPPARSTESAISSSLRACRSFSGAASRTTSYSGSRPRASSATRRCSPRKSRACSPTRARSARRELRGPVARAPRARRFPVPRSGLRRRPARRISPRDGAAVRRRAARAPQRARAARRGLHLPQRAPRCALRHRRRPRQLHAARRAAAGQPAARVARPRQLPDDDVGAEPHVARRARAVDRAEPARRGGAEPAARRGRRSREGSGDAAHLAGDTLRERLEMHRGIRPAPRAMRSWTRSVCRSRTSISWAVGASRKTAMRSTRRPR